MVWTLVVASLLGGLWFSVDTTPDYCKGGIVVEVGGCAGMGRCVVKDDRGANYRGVYMPITGMDLSTSLGCPSKRPPLGIRPK
jgi:hypothetical protein